MKANYYASNDITILIAEVKGPAHRPVNAPRDAKLMPCRPTWYYAASKANLFLKNGFYAVLTLTKKGGTDYDVLAIVDLEPYLKDKMLPRDKELMGKGLLTKHQLLQDYASSISYSIHGIQKANEAADRPAVDDWRFVTQCITLGLLQDPGMDANELMLAFHDKTNPLSPRDVFTELLV